MAIVVREGQRLRAEVPVRVTGRGLLVLRGITRDVQGRQVGRWWTSPDLASDEFRQQVVGQDLVVTMFTAPLSADVLYPASVEWEAVLLDPTTGRELSRDTRIDPGVFSVERGQPKFQLVVESISSPVAPGQRANARVRVTNVGTAAGSVTVTGDTVDGAGVRQGGWTSATTPELQPGQSAVVSLTSLGPIDPMFAGQVLRAVFRAGGASVSAAFQVASPPQPKFALSVESISSPVQPGTYASARVRVTNTGTGSGSATVTGETLDGYGVRQGTWGAVQTPSLAPGQSAVVSLTSAGPIHAMFAGQTLRAVFRADGAEAAATFVVARPAAPPQPVPSPTPAPQPPLPVRPPEPAPVPVAPPPPSGGGGGFWPGPPPYYLIAKVPARRTRLHGP